MNFKLKEEPKVIYQLITYEFTLTNDNGDLFQLRYSDDDNGATYYLLEDGVWREFFPDDEMFEFIMNEIEFSL